jgi:hypothetical protein
VINIRRTTIRRKRGGLSRSLISKMSLGRLRNYNRLKKTCKTKTKKVKIKTLKSTFRVP